VLIEWTCFITLINLVENSFKCWGNSIVLFSISSNFIAELLNKFVALAIWFAIKFNCLTSCAVEFKYPVSSLNINSFSVLDSTTAFIIDDSSNLIFWIKPSIIFFNSSCISFIFNSLIYYQNILNICLLFLFQ